MRGRQQTDDAQVVVEVELVRGHEVNLFRIPCCPFCSELHYHGAGRVTDEPAQFQGPREPHCESNRGYVLVWKGAVGWPLRTSAHAALIELPVAVGVISLPLFEKA